MAQELSSSRCTDHRLIRAALPLLLLAHWATFKGSMSRLTTGCRPWPGHSTTPQEFCAARYGCSEIAASPASGNARCETPSMLERDRGDTGSIDLRGQNHCVECQRQRPVHRERCYEPAWRVLMPRRPCTERRRMIVWCEAVHLTKPAAITLIRDDVIDLDCTSEPELRLPAIQLTCIHEPVTPAPSDSAAEWISS